jgi:hypothetical protein
MPAPQPLDVLVTSEAWQSALACIQSFGRRGYRGGHARA